MAKRNSPRIARVLRRMDGPAAALQSPVVSLPGCAGAHLSVGPGSVLGERVVVARNCRAVVKYTAPPPRRPFLSPWPL
jgi:hydrogenase maturation factor HypE